MTSHTSTPNLVPSSNKDLPPLSPSLLSTSQSSTTPASNDPLSGVPELTTTILDAEDDRTAALKLIADSIAQQRQAANYALITSPVALVLLPLLCFAIYRQIYLPNYDTGKSVTTLAGTVMVGLALVRMLGAGYLTAAEGINWSFLRASSAAAGGGEQNENQDLLLGSKFGSEIIGALVLRIEGSRKRRRSGGSSGKSSSSSHSNSTSSSNHNSSSSNTNSNSSSNGKPKALVRAWTTKYRYRHKGIGTSLLEEAVRIAREKAGKDVEVGFALDHANSLRILPKLFNGHFDRGEAKAVRALQAVTGVVETKKGGKR